MLFPLHEAEMDLADEMAISLGQFEERAVPQPDRLALGLRREAETAKQVYGPACRSTPRRCGLPSLEELRQSVIRNERW